MSVLRAILGVFVLVCGVFWADSATRGDALAPPPVFTDITAASGIRFQHVSGDPKEKNYIFETKGGGIAAFDYDNDGWVDVLMTQGCTLERYKANDCPGPSLYRNRGDGTFEDVTEKAGIKCRGWGMGVGIGDYDNDGNADIWLTYLGRDVLYRNNGNGTFTDVTEKAGLKEKGWKTSAAFGDYDKDGYLDVYVAGYLDVGPDKLPPSPAEKGLACQYMGRAVMCGPRGLPGLRDFLYHNKGDGTFEEVSEQTGAADKNKYYGLGVVFGDVNNDGLPDIYVADDATPSLLFVNKGGGKFEEYGMQSGLAVSGDGNEQAGMGVDLADYDNDGRLDAFVTHFAKDYSTLYHNEGGLVFADVTRQAGIEIGELPYVSWSTRFLDLNNDGFKDLIWMNGHVYPFLATGKFGEDFEQPPCLYLNRGNGTFVDMSREAGADFQKKFVGRGAAFADFDNDGDIDFITSNLGGTPILYRNDRRDKNHWVMFKTAGRKSNRDGIGARITVETGKMKQIWEIKRTVGIYSASDPRAHFGVGQSQKIDVVRVAWPSGKQQEFRDVAVDEHYQIDEGKDTLEKEPIRPIAKK